MKLWYKNEAKEWTEAPPIGNGHMGAMCYGGAGGRFDLSENTCSVHHCSFMQGNIYARKCR